MSNRPILLNVDDHEVARYARTRVLTNAGFVVHEAGTGAEAFEMVAKHKPDVVLLDVHLPDINGMEVCRRLKANIKDDPMIVVQITASALSPSHAKESLDGGADAYITEPVDPDVLVATVRAMLRLHDAERSLAHANRQLAITNAELVRSNEDLAHFAFAASHDLQEPLRMISTFTELVQREAAGKFTPQERDYFAQVLKGAARMRSLIRDLLVYSQAGREMAPREVVSLQEVVAWALDNLKEPIRASDAVVTMQENLPEVLGNFSQLGQVIQNLVSNSLKYRRSDAPLTVDIRAEPQSGAHWKVSIRDSGRGIALEHHERVFAPFKRLHGSDIPGTGIGLALCRRLIESHGGRIWIESEEGQGAAFFFTLPAS